MHTHARAYACSELGVLISCKIVLMLHRYLLQAKRHTVFGEASRKDDELITIQPEVPIRIKGFHGRLRAPR